MIDEKWRKLLELGPQLLWDFDVHLCEAEPLLRPKELGEHPCISLGVVVRFNKPRTAWHLLHHGAGVERVSVIPQDSPAHPSILGVPIEHVSSVKSLGIFIDENLRWQTHIDKLSKKVASGIGAIKRIRTFVPPPTLHYIYNSLIQSHFDYCNLVWGNCGKTLFDRLQKLQNRAARVLTFSSYDADASRLIRQLDWKDLSTQFQIQKSIMVYKSLNGLVPEYLSSKFVKRNETRYFLRDSVNKLFVPFPRTNFMKNSFTYSGAVLWNSLPCHVREAESLSQFKRLVNVHF